MTETKRQPDVAAFLLRRAALGLRPDPRRGVDEWAVAQRHVNEGANEGPWRHERAPYLREIMQRVSLNCPTRRVSLLGSAQLGKTQVGLNLLGQVLCETPAAVIVALPSLNSMRMYNRDKLDRMIRGTPALKSAVADITDRSGQGSTTAVKRGARDAQVELVTASSSRDLQSRTARVVVMEEVSEYEADVGGRGDPVEQLEARTIQWRRRGEKIVKISTPGIKGNCRISKAVEEGSGGIYLVPCPHCDARQTLQFANLRWTPGKPDDARYACDACGTLIEESRKLAMLNAGEWVHARPDLLNVHASYRINTLYSYFTPWSEVARQAEKVEADPSIAKTFHQQWLGEAWDEAHDLPKAEVLLMRRAQWKPGSVPAGVLVLMGSTDVQADRLVWAVWGFDRNFGQWLVETGTLLGDPTLPDVWDAHDRLLARSWRDEWGRERGPDVWGLDAGYLSQHVYAYCRRHAQRANPQVRALDGRDGWKLPAIGQPSTRDIDWMGRKIGQVQLWPVGTWDIKSELAAALRLTEQGPGPDGWPVGALRFNEMVDKGWLEELLAEMCVVNPRTGKLRWVKVKPRNEAWDLAVYARALARQATLRFGTEEWGRLETERTGPIDLKARAVEAVKAPPPAQPVVRAPRREWIEPRNDWI